MQRLELTRAYGKASAGFANAFHFAYGTSKSTKLKNLKGAYGFKFVFIFFLKKGLTRELTPAYAGDIPALGIAYAGAVKYAQNKSHNDKPRGGGFDMSHISFRILRD